VEYRRPSVCSDGTVLFAGMKLQTDGDVRTMFSIFSQFMTKGPIELEARFVRSVESICSNLIRQRTFDEIVACMIQPGEEDEVELVNLSVIKHLFNSGSVVVRHLESEQRGCSLLGKQTHGVFAPWRANQGGVRCLQGETHVNRIRL
jgi:hypothetical protein